MDSDAGYHETQPVRSARFHLWSILAIVMSTVFVGLVAVFTENLAASWPLLIVPIIIAALAYEVPGAIAAAAACALVVAVLLPGLASGSRSEMLVGLVTFVGCGVVVGVQSQRSRHHTLVLEHSSVRDQESGLYKPAYFRARLAEELRRGARHDVNVSLVLIHVDGLPDFRETFGSYKASLLLEHMADILRIAVRDTDIVGRYGPDSFGAVLPFAGPAEAALVADRIQLAVCSAEFEGDVLQPAARCAVTVSAASFPADTSEQAALQTLAEERLAALLPLDSATTADSRSAGVMRTGEARS